MYYNNIIIACIYYMIMLLVLIFDCGNHKQFSISPSRVVRCWWAPLTSSSVQAETLSSVSPFDYIPFAVLQFRLKVFHSTENVFSVALCSSVSAAFLSWSLSVYVFSVSSFSAAVSAARWVRSLSLILWSLRSLAVGDVLHVHCRMQLCLIVYIVSQRMHAY